MRNRSFWPRLLVTSTRKQLCFFFQFHCQLVCWVENHHILMLTSLLTNFQNKANKSINLHKLIKEFEENHQSTYYGPGSSLPKYKIRFSVLSLQVKAESAKHVFYNHCQSLNLCLTVLVFRFGLVVCITCICLAFYLLNSSCPPSICFSIYNTRCFWQCPC